MQENINVIKSEIKKYYQNIKAIEEQNRRLERLNANLKSIADDINNPRFNHSLNTDVKAVRYDEIIVKCGALPSSSMDREIESIYNNLEKEYKNTEEEILQTKALIRKLENENDEMNFYISMLSADYKNILNLKYGQKKSIYQIAYIINISEATVSRYLNSIYCDLYKFKKLYEKK